MPSKNSKTQPSQSLGGRPRSGQPNDRQTWRSPLATHRTAQTAPPRTTSTRGGGDASGSCGPSDGPVAGGTVAKWWRRWCELGETGLVDRSLRPHRTDAKVEERIADCGAGRCICRLGRVCRQRRYGVSFNATG